MPFADDLTVTLRPYTSEDEATVLAWLDDPVTNQFVYRFSPNGFSVRPHDLLIGVLPDGTPCSLVHRTMPWVHLLLVAPEMRGRGLGSATVRRLIEAPQTPDEIWARVSPKNLASMRAFTAQGFAPDPGHSDEHTVLLIYNPYTPPIALRDFLESDRPHVQTWIDGAAGHQIGTFSLDNHEDRYRYSVAAVQNATPSAFLAHSPQRVGVLIVNPEHRRRGVAKRTIREFLALPDTKDEVWALVARDNAPSLNTFTSLGFEEHHDHDLLPPAVWLQLRLPSVNSADSEQIQDHPV